MELNVGGSQVGVTEQVIAGGSESPHGYFARTRVKTSTA